MFAHVQACMCQHGMHGEHVCAVVVSCNGWMFALTWNADIKHEPAELWELAQSKYKMNADAPARKATTLGHLL